MKTKHIVLIVALFVLLSSCSQPAASPTSTETALDPTSTVALTSTAASTAEPTPTVAPAMEPGGTFEPAPCPFDVPDDAVIECGYVVVPEDHTALRMLSTRIRCASPSPSSKIKAIITNPTP